MTQKKSEKSKKILNAVRHLENDVTKSFLNVLMEDKVTGLGNNNTVQYSKEQITHPYFIFSTIITHPKINVTTFAMTTGKEFIRKP